MNAEAIYGRTRLVEDAINLRSPELFSTLQEDTATQAARRDLFTGIAKSTGLPQGVVVALAERAINDALSAARPRSDDEAAETAFNREQQIQRDNETVLAELRIRHGEKGAAELLSRTQRWVRSHPKLAEVLRENDRGSDLSIVRPIIDFVFTTGAGR